MQIDETIRPLVELRGDCAKAGACIAQRELRPSGEVSVLSRAMRNEVAAGELSEPSVTVEFRAGTQPVIDEYERVVTVDQRPADDQPIQRRAKQDMHERLPCRRHACLLE